MAARTSRPTASTSTARSRWYSSSSRRNRSAKSLIADRHDAGAPPPAAIPRSTAASSSASASSAMWASKMPASASPDRGDRDAARLGGSRLAPAMRLRQPPPLLLRGAGGRLHRRRRDRERRDGGPGPTAMPGEAPTAPVGDRSGAIGRRFSWPRRLVTEVVGGELLEGGEHPVGIDAGGGDLDPVATDEPPGCRWR